ncbi:hypothetical protein [Arenibacter sp. ARW7G5Y1]|uniref:hypothetical protein n=1 Tax=Arenibacter sp. ARW7G5Y1 TaxID=2135619 RepID=UPI0011B65740|nr:hypothetical protein [Arenibacter sp. ARW7G5Y1]
MEIELKNFSMKTILIVIGIGIWAIVLQNAGVIPTKQNVYVKGGYIDADVSGSVDIDNTVDVNGYIDVNIQAINGKSNAFYKDRDGDYVLLPVLSR